MSYTFDIRPSDSPFVDKIWHTRSECPVTFTSHAESQWEIVVTQFEGKTRLSVRGPETKATVADGAPEIDVFGISFHMGTYMPHLPLKRLLDLNDEHLPEAASNTFWLDNSVWEYPTFDNADTFVDRLVRQGILTCDPVVQSVLNNQPYPLSQRSIQRRFVHVTGLTHKTIQQINRAQRANALLIEGKPILDTVYELGYYDQSHLTNALTHFMGVTPAQLIANRATQQL